jgi:hypothetical protein
MKDREKNLWLGTEGRGLLKLDLDKIVLKPIQ